MAPAGDAGRGSGRFRGGRGAFRYVPECEALAVQLVELSGCKIGVESLNHESPYGHIQHKKPRWLTRSVVKSSWALTSPQASLTSCLYSLMPQLRPLCSYKEMHL